MSKNRFVLNSKGVRELLKSEEIAGECMERAKRMAESAGDGYAVIFVGSPFFTEEFQVSRYVVIGKCVGCVIMVAGKIQIINIGCAPHSVKDFVYRSNLYALSVKHISCQNDRADIVFCGILGQSEK